MRIFRARYRVSGNPEDMRSILAARLAYSGENGNQAVYIDEQSDLGTRKFRYSELQNEIVEEFYSDYRYPIFCATILLLNLLCRATNLFSEISKSLILITTGVGGILLYIISYLTVMKKYDFLYTSLDSYENYGIPFVSRRELRVTIISYTMLVIGIINLLPWIIPRTNLLSVVLAVTAFLAMLITMRRDTNDRVTAQFFFLFSLVTVPITSTVSNILIYTQISAYRSQEKIALNIFSEIGLPRIEGSTVISYSSYTIFCILILNIVLFIAVIRLGPVLWSRIATIEPNRIAPDHVSHDRVVRLSMALIVGTYTISAVVIPISVVFDLGLVNVGAITDLLWLYSPAIVIGAFHCSIKVRRYLELRSILFELVTEAPADIGTGDQARLLFSDRIDNAAVSVDMINRDPAIIINESLAQVLETSEVRAIYQHEVFHLKNKSYRYQRLPNLPLIGPFLFFIIINPKKVYQEEYKADEYAVSEVSKKAVVSALHKSNQFTGLIDPKNTVENKHQSVTIFLLFLTTIPVVSLYRPTIAQRIHNITYD